MPIGVEEFEEAREEALKVKPDTNAERVLNFLVQNRDKAFTRKEIQEGTGVKPGSIGTVLSRLEESELVRHKGHYWALAKEDRITKYLASIRATETANERLGVEDKEEWLKHAEDQA